MTAKVFDEFNSLVFFLLPELQVTITARCYDEIGPKRKNRRCKKSLHLSVNAHFINSFLIYAIFCNQLKMLQFYLVATDVCFSFSFQLS